MIGRTLVLWWFPAWHPIRFHRWEPPLDKTYHWSLLLGWLELRRLR